MISSNIDGVIGYFFIKAAQIAGQRRLVRGRVQEPSSPLLELFALRFRGEGSRVSDVVDHPAKGVEDRDIAPALPA